MLALNDGLAFESHYHEIYPEELQLTKENPTNDETNFLDLNIKITNRVFTTTLYDKRDHFGFDITRLPYRNSNIPCLCSTQVSLLNAYAYAELLL